MREKARAKKERSAVETRIGKLDPQRRYGGTFGRKGEKRRKRDRREQRNAVPRIS